MQVGPKYKICRRLGSRVFPQCQTTRFSISGSPQKQKGGKQKFRRRNLSDFSVQLLEKQKARFTYGLKERQLSSYVSRVTVKAGITPTEAIYQALESRLDNIIFRFGVVPSRAFARQLVTHGHILVNGRRLNVPSYSVKVGDKISVRPQSQRLPIFTELEKKLKDYRSPAWLNFDLEKLEGGLIAKPKLGEPPSELNWGTLLEFYSRV